MSTLMVFFIKEKIYIILTLFAPRFRCQNFLAPTIPTHNSQIHTGGYCCARKGIFYVDRKEKNHH
jgi:hypothetical protein